MGELLLLAGIVVAVIGLILGALIWQGNNKIKRKIAEANQRHKTHFSFGPTEAMGNNRQAVFFDPKARKLLFYDNGNYSLHDYGYISGWELNWTQLSRQNSAKCTDVVMRIKTKDLARPVIDLPMRSKAYGDVWEQRLHLVLDTPASV